MTTLEKILIALTVIFALIFLSQLGITLPSTARAQEAKAIPMRYQSRSGTVIERFTFENAECYVAYWGTGQRHDQQLACIKNKTAE